MPRKKLRRDLNETAFDIVKAATGQAAKPQAPGERTVKHPEAVKRGKKGGKLGGAARAEALSDRQLKNAARKAAQKRWKGERSA